VLKIEGKKVPAIDVVNEIRQLQNNQKQTSYYLPQATRNIMVKLQETGAANEEPQASPQLFKHSNKYISKN